MSGVLDALLGDPLAEAFDAAEHPRDFRGRFRAGEHVTFSHGFLGKLPAEVTKVTDSRVHISYVPGKGERSSTSMTHSQAAAKLEHMTGPLAPRQHLARGQTANELSGGIPQMSMADRRQRQEQLERDRRTAAGLSNEPIRFNGPPAAQKRAASVHPVGVRVQGKDSQGRPLGPPGIVDDHTPDGSTVVRYDDGSTQTFTKPEALMRYNPAAPGNIGSSRRRLSESVIDGLLEGFGDRAHEPDWNGRFEKGDKVRVSVKGGRSVVGRVLRASSSKPDHVVIRPDGSGPHVEAHKDSVRLDTPQQHNQMRRREEASRADLLPPGQTGPAVSKAQARRVGATPAGPPVRESLSVAALVEAFQPTETPAQSMAIGAAQQTAAQASLEKGWTSVKHPRGQHGRFAYTTGGRRATRSSSAKGRTLGVGSKGALIKSIQRQVGANPDGIYGSRTRAAVERFQRQHGLQVDGVVGAQTLAALRGHANARLVKPGPITTRSARVLTHPLTRASRSTAKAKAVPKVKAAAQVTVKGHSVAPVKPVSGTRFAGGRVVP